jgi:hypothetical protein
MRRFLRPEPKRTDEVFGISNSVLPDSYVDRGYLDEEIARLLKRPVHIALRGVSKCGKSWLRQTSIPNAIVIQCRLGKTVVDLYREALGELDVRLEVNSQTSSTLTGRVEATGEVGIKLLGKVGGKAGVDVADSEVTTSAPVSADINDLRLVADILIESGRRLVVEDFHYLSIDERKKFAFDLKALWDFGVFVVIIGVWSEQNMLLFLNPDLTGRTYEVAIEWTREDLRKIFSQGGSVLNLQFSDRIQESAITDCYQNAGILQTLILGMLDRLNIAEASSSPTEIDSMDALESAGMFYAEQLNPLYQQFARRVAVGIRTRQNATGIYAHSMAVILATSDAELIRGVPLDQIFQEANRRESRIQKGNLRTVLERLESLQVDEDGRGLVLAYNEATGEIAVVDRQLLLYRKYSTVQWPWEDLIREAEEQKENFEHA